jgi:hypothetical protein
MSGGVVLSGNAQAIVLPLYPPHPSGTPPKRGLDLGEALLNPDFNDL